MNKSYWEKYYLKQRTKKPSPFAKYCNKIIPKGSSIVELGCGNGRDSYYFAKKGHTVRGIDYSVLPPYKKNVFFVKQDLKKVSKNLKNFSGIIYSRFLLHAVSEKTLTEILKQSKGLFVAETRSIEDKSFVSDHKRNLVEGNKLILNLIKNKFKILYFKEGKDMAISGNQNPTVIRVIAKKEEN